MSGSMPSAGSGGTATSGGLAGGDWTQHLVLASWRGVPFATRKAAIRPGRQTAVHTYPYRDVVWVEDLGRNPRPYRITGFLVDGDPKISRLPIFTQRASMMAACETSGTGILIHPSLTSKSVALIGGAEMTESSEFGGCIEISFEFLETVPGPVYPTGTTTAATAIASASAAFNAAAVTSFSASTSLSGPYVTDPLNTGLSTVASAINSGISAVHAAIAAVSVFVVPVLSAMRSVSLIINSVTGVAGLVGRYVGGTRATLQAAGVSIEDAIAGVTTARTTVTIACDTAITAAGGLGGPNVAAQAANAATLGAAIQAMTEAVRVGCQDPYTAIQLLVPLAGFSYVPATGADSIGVAVQTVTQGVVGLCRRAAISSIAAAVATYQPTSYQDAVSLRYALCALIDGEMLLVDSSTAQALRLLRTAVIYTLNTAAQNLAAVILVTEPSSRPGLAIAYSLYQDASRYSELVNRVDPINPNMFPVQFEALAS